MREPAARPRGSAASRRARSTPPRCASCGTSGRGSTARELPELTESKLGMLALAARRQRLSVDQATAARPGQRDRVGQGQQRRPRRLRRARRAPAAARSPASTPRLVAPCSSAPTRRSSASQGRMDMEDVAAVHAPACWPTTSAVAAQVRRQYKWFVVDEFQDVSPLQYALLDLWLGGRDELCVVGDPAQTIYSFAGADARYLREFPQRFPAATSVELVRNYRSTPEVVAAANTLLAGTPSKGVDLVAQRPAGPRRDLPQATDEVAEADGRRRPDRRAARRGHAAERDRGAVPHQRPVRGLRGGARRAGHPVRRPRRGPLLRPRRGREAVALLRGAARGGEAAGRPCRGGAGRAVRHGLDAPSRPAARGQVRDRWESLQALVDQAADRAASGRRRPRRLRRRPRPPRRRAARPRRRRRHPGHPPHRQGPGVGRRLRRRRARGHAADHQRQTPAEVEEERRLLYVGDDPRPRQLARVVGAARNPGGRANRASRRGSSTPLLAGGQASPRQRATAPSATARPCAAASAEAAATPRRRRPAAAPTARRPTTRRCSSGSRSGAWPAPRGRACPAFVVFTDATLQLIAEHAPTDERACARSAGSARASSPSTATTCSLVGWPADRRSYGKKFSR